ncbi:Ribonuclease H domain [Arabidopsis thaliana x Arabidopsis arenosa]|uniref:Ribonuclease H domain n=1 Tax=Arabidopsis thaliana x Arabidopsis arenosa TaxID=1240361 RepID=A0A8T2C4S0_9BRAS|nr:Ribonuclease H domain [Arabidopsis thaliana x Arabidopsis arenosa]
MWRIWKSRNNFLFQKKNRHPSSEARKGIEEANEWMEAQDLQTHKDRPSNVATRPPQTTSRSRQREPPPLGWLKCNFDSGFVQGNEFTPTGWIIRDSHGQMITSGNAKLRYAQTALQAEALGFLHALQMTWAHGFRCVWFEGDNLELINLINRNADHEKLGTLLYDIHHWMRKLPRASLGHVNRERNSAADMLSRQASYMNHLYQSFNVPPRWLVSTVYYINKDRSHGTTELSSMDVFINQHKKEVEGFKCLLLLSHILERLTLLTRSPAKYNYSRSPGFYAEREVSSGRVSLKVSVKSMEKEVSSVVDLIRVGRNCPL